MPGSACRSNSCIHDFPQDHVVLGTQQKCSVGFPFYHRIKKTYPQGASFNKIRNFSTSLRTVLSEVHFFPPLKCLGWRMQSIGVFMVVDFIHISFVRSVQVSEQWQKQLLNVCMKIGFTSQTPERVSGTLGDPWAMLEKQKQFEMLSHRIDMVTDNESGWYLTFFLSLVIFSFFSWFVSNCSFFQMPVASL